MSPTRQDRCDRGGWLVGPGDLIADRAWREGSPPWGCSHLVCGRCGREVRSFAGVLLARRPDPAEWRAIHGGGDWSAWLESDGGTLDWRTYLCGCRAFPASRAVDLQGLAVDDDLSWECGGHGVAEVLHPVDAEAAAPIRFTVCTGADDDGPSVNRARASSPPA